jgi:photosystem II stability/assembly factor-like uncharacterized protein
VTITSGSNGSGSGPVNYTVGANTGASRNCALTIAGKNFQVAQAGIAPPGSWLAQTSGTNEAINSVHFINDNAGWAAGVNTTMLRTTDGLNWSECETGVVNANGFNSVRFLDANLGVVGGGKAVKRVTNGCTGGNTSNFTLDSDFRNRWFPISPTTVWAAGLGPHQGNPQCRKMWRHTVDGAGFINIDFIYNGCAQTSALLDVQFLDLANGWAVGASGVIVRVTDGTAIFPTFTDQTSNTTHNLNGLHMLDLNTGWVVGNNGTILKTTNGGATWTPRTSGTTANLNDVHFADANTGWIAGNGGLILITTDGGNTWAPEPSGTTANLLSIHGATTNAIYAVGASGTILKRTTCAPPTITTQPVSQTVCVGAPVTFTVVAAGTGPLSYQWYKDGIPIPGATASSYSIPSVTPGDAGNYHVVVTNECGSAASNVMVLTVNTPPTIPIQPVGQTVCAGDAVTLSVQATGTGPLGYQWRKNGVNISGATGSSYTIPSVTPGHVGSYDVVVSNTCGSVISNPSFLSVNPATSINTPPANQTACVGTSATFSVTAGGTGPFTYQWRKNGSNIPGATGIGYTIASVAAGDAGNYDVIVTGTCGSATSPPATLTVNTPPAITQQPVNQTVCVGGSASFSVMANGTGPLSYQWRKNGVNIPGANSSSYTINPVTANDAASYDVVVTGACGNATSNPATLTVNAATTITTHPISQAACLGTQACFSVTAGGTGPFTYQWRKNGTNIPSATSSLFCIPSVAQGDASNYDVVVTGACGTATSNPAALTVNAPPAITAHPSSQTVCETNQACFSVTATGANLTYQWRRNGVNIPNATAAQYCITAVTPGQAGNYDVIVANTCGTVMSTVATLAVNTAPSVTTQPVSQTVVVGDTAVFNAAASGTPAPSVQWQLSTDGGATFTGIPGATSATLTLAPVTLAQNGNRYRAVFTNACGSAESNPATLTVTGLQYYPLPRPIRLFDTRAPIPGFAACEYQNQLLLSGEERVIMARAFAKSAR